VSLSIKINFSLYCKSSSPVCSCFYSRLTLKDWTEEMIWRRFPRQRRRSFWTYLLCNRHGSSKVLNSQSKLFQKIALASYFQRTSSELCFSQILCRNSVTGSFFDFSWSIFWGLAFLLRYFSSQTGDIHFTLGV